MGRGERGGALRQGTAGRPQRTRCFTPSPPRPQERLRLVRLCDVADALVTTFSGGTERLSLASRPAATAGAPLAAPRPRPYRAWRAPPPPPHRSLALLASNLMGCTVLSSGAHAMLRELKRGRIVVLMSGITWSRPALVIAASGRPAPVRRGERVRDGCVRAVMAGAREGQEERRATRPLPPCARPVPSCARPRAQARR